MSSRWLWLTIPAVAVVGFAAGLAAARVSSNIAVEITGSAVTRPGIYILPRGARVYDAIKEAGGLDCFYFFVSFLAMSNYREFPELQPTSFIVSILSRGKSYDACLASIIDDGALISIDARNVQDWIDDSKEGRERPLNETGVLAPYLSELRRIGQCEFLSSNRVIELDALPDKELSAYRLLAAKAQRTELSPEDLEQLGQWASRCFAPYDPAPASGGEE